jgi:hypothetical protein
MKLRYKTETPKASKEVRLDQIRLVKLFSKIFSFLSSREPVLPHSAANRPGFQGQVRVPPSTWQNIPGAVVRLSRTPSRLVVLHLPLHRVSISKTCSTTSALGSEYFFAVTRKATCKKREIMLSLRV